MQAEITYNAGKSCTMKGFKFYNGVTKLVSDDAIISHCQVTDGFAVRILNKKLATSPVPASSPVPAIPKKVLKGSGPVPSVADKFKNK